jgi:hypothetical protein
MIDQQPISQPMPSQMMTTPVSPAKPPKSGLIKPALIILAIWQVLLVVFLTLASLQINQLSSDLTTAKQQYNLLVHFEQIPK